VLASLASVREALGRHDEAEIMWRRVLAVRERTLPPNHFATATALERLAESCAARGKLREALQLLKRATTMRELTLGPTHHSVRIARDRIADLQLQSSADAPDGFVEPPPRAQAVPQPLPPFLPLPAPQAAPERAARAEVPTLSGAPDGHALQMQLQAPPSHEELAVIQAEHEELLAIQADQEKLLAIEAKLAAAAEYEDGEEEGEERSVGKSLAAAALLMDRRRVPVIVTGAVAVVLLLGAGVVRSRAASPVGSPQELQASVPAPSEPADARSGTRLVPATATAPAPITVEHREVLPAALETVHRPPAAQRRDDGDAAPSRSQIATAPVVAPKLLKNLDSFARSVKTPAVSMSDAYSVRLASDSPNKKFDPGVPENASELVRAELIGAPPQPRFPEGLRDRKLDGEVVIRFVVDAQGRPDPATITILRSPHELFSEAVRRVIPTMRFEAAHRTGIGARAEPDQVQMAFRFSSGTR
jgi:TonB family protein